MQTHMNLPWTSQGYYSHKTTNTYEFWKDAFPILYHGTVEEVAARYSYVDKILRLHLADA